MKAFIFCGGNATRFNNGKPGPLKALITVNRIPIIKRIINNLKKNSVKQIFLLGGYKFNELKSFIRGLNKKGDIKVINTKKNTTTAGRLAKVKKLIDKDEIFLLTYGDSLVNFKIKNALKLKKKNNFVISSYKYKFMYGILDFNKYKVLTKMTEKKYFFLNSGYYILDSKIFSFINSSRESFEQDVIPRVLKSKKVKFKINKVNSWFPIDNNEDRKRANDYFKKNEKV
jgi:NDP-sugar pyrophosphorylase family protein